MSDFYNNDNNSSNTNGQNGAGTYSYKKEDINQGESYYQWSPYDDGNRARAKKQPSFGKKLGRATVIALVFGLVAGLAFQSVVVVSNKLIENTVTESSSKIEDKKDI